MTVRNPDTGAVNLRYRLLTVQLGGITDVRCFNEVRESNARPLTPPLNTGVFKA